jgi:hypothetical protein
MVVYANLLRRRFDGLLYEVYEIWRAEFAECLEGLGAGFDCGLQLILVDPAGQLVGMVRHWYTKRTVAGDR